MNKIITTGLLCASLLTTVSCATADKNTNLTTNTNAAANTNSNAVSDENSAAKEAGGAQTQTAPDALVADLYKQHDAKKSPFFQTKNRALVDKYFTKSTADLIWKDAVNSKGEVGALEADPLYDAQDTDIKNFKVGQAKINGDSATVPVTFQNFGKKFTINFLLKQENGNWKIENINYGDYNFLEFFKENSSSNETPKSSTNEFEGKYQVGDTTATVKPIKMAFEVKWEKGAGTETFFSEGEANDKFIFASRPKTGKANVFSFDDENYNSGTFYRADGKEFPIKRIN